MEVKMVKNNLRKLSDREVTDLKGKLLEVRRIGAQPIFIKIVERDTIKVALRKADIPTSDGDLKVEGIKENSTSWTALTLQDKAVKFSKIAVTTKVSGA